MLVFEKNNAYKGEINKVKQNNIKLERKIETKKFELENLQELLEPEKYANKTRDPNQIKDAHTRRRLMEEKKQREREILKKKLAAAVDLVGEGEEVNLTKAKKRNILKEYWEGFLNFLDSIKPFRKDISEIEVNYDKSIGIFF